MALSLGLGLSLSPFGGITTPQNFVLTAATTIASETMTIPCLDIGVFNAVIDWGDGGTSTVTAYNDAGLSHVYAGAGTYTISISGLFPNVRFASNTTMAAKVRTVESLGVMGWVALSGSFSFCLNMTSFNGNGDTTNVTTHTSMLSGNTSLVSVSLGGFSTAASTNTSWMFSNVPCTNLSLSALDVANVTNMAGMLYLVGTVDLAIDGWDVSNVVNMNALAIGGNIPTLRYDAILRAWDLLTVKPNLSPNFGSSKYTLGGASEAARASLIANDFWTITDGGGV